MSNRKIIVTGYFGAPIEETAKKLAASEGLEYISLDEEIMKRDGRSIKRLVMMNGEHGYRNQEYEVLQELCGGEEEAADTDAPAGAAESDAPACAAESDAPACDAESAAPAGEAAGNGAGLVIACGDGVLYDDDSREIISRHELVIAGEEMTTEGLWENAKAIEDSYHAFMAFGTEKEKRAAFEQLIQRQRNLFAQVRGENSGM